MPVVDNSNTQAEEAQDKYHPQEERREAVQAVAVPLDPLEEVLDLSSIVLREMVERKKVLPEDRQTEPR